jgi:tetratricopeptide (TPR) repeat protein
MLYNFLRVDNPLEFGLHYQLGRKRLTTQQFFSLRYLWFNFRVYFLEPARWSARFPFVHDITVPPMPPGYYGASDPFGILTNIPLVWLALTVPLAWWRRSGQARSVLRWFTVAVIPLFGTCVLTLGFYGYSAIRYEVEFLPALVLLAVIGVLSLERAVAGQPFWRRAARWGWGLLLGFSVVFNLLVGAENWAHAGCTLGTMLAEEGRVSEGIQVLQRGLRANADYADGQEELGHALLLAGRMQEAIGHCEQALQLNPDDALAHNDLALALVRLGRVRQAMEHWEQALRIRADYTEAHNNLGNALLLVGKVQEAIEHYEQVIRLQPDWAGAQYNLGNALEQAGRAREAIQHYEQALRIRPDFVQAQNALARLRGAE